jgi:hypothetical protein
VASRARGVLALLFFVIRIASHAQFACDAPDHSPTQNLPPSSRIAPDVFAHVAGQSAVVHQPAPTDTATLAALLSCPT